MAKTIKKLTKKQLKNLIMEQMKTVKEDSVDELSFEVDIEEITNSIRNFLATSQMTFMEKSRMLEKLKMIVDRILEA